MKNRSLGLGAYLLTLLLIGMACSMGSSLQRTASDPAPAARDARTPGPSEAGEGLQMDDSEIVLSEDFDGPDSCLINGPSSEGGEIYQEGGELHIIAPPAPREFELAPPLTWSVCEDETLSNFIVEVDATTLDGTVNNGYGILFRANEDRFYAYFISADGFDCLAFMDIGAGEEYPAVGCWSQIDEINQGMETNRIRVEAVDDELRIFVNGVLVGLARENFAYRGQVGLFAASYANQETHVSFDNLLVVEK